MSRESVPCGCQQPPKSTANLSVAIMDSLGSVSATSRCSARGWTLGDLERDLAPRLRAHFAAASKAEAVGDLNPTGKTNETQPSDRLPCPPTWDHIYCGDTAGTIGATASLPQISPANMLSEKTYL